MGNTYLLKNNRGAIQFNPLTCNSTLSVQEDGTKMESEGKDFIKIVK